MSKYSELAGLDYTTHESGVTKTTTPPTPEPVEPPVFDVPHDAPIEEIPPVYENPLDDMPVATEESAVTETFPVGDLEEMSKIKLEEIGRTFGVELDRRLSQPKLVKQLKEIIEQQQD